MASVTDIWLHVVLATPCHAMWLYACCPGRWIVGWSIRSEIDVIVLEGRLCGIGAHSFAILLNYVIKYDPLSPSHPAVRIHPCLIKCGSVPYGGRMSASIPWIFSRERKRLRGRWQGERISLSQVREENFPNRAHANTAPTNRDVP
ncbi:hypothetical protein NPIL_233661 [Nephila pilipes]|uniref:Uncharacterized protein n=1 Tax=Nephila pilipes TaxID=299642 RepID=A0A8X6PSV5_NEPPI|nr:hypothetical protein NPIL_233661 [Nephila pilipes]